jgi:antitoxin component of RelBE/YafQ-DinJ toxin-antitoxin module
MANKRKPKSASVAARMPSIVKAAAVEMATEDGQSLSSFLESLIRAEARHRGLPIRVSLRPPMDREQVLKGYSL